MGIKTKINPLGGRSSSSDLGNLSLWRYSNGVIAGKTLLYNYMGEWNSITLYGYYSPMGSGYTYYRLNTNTPRVGEPLYLSNGAVSREYIESVSGDGFCPDGWVLPTFSYFKYNQKLDIRGITDPLYVPTASGKAVINDWVNSSSSGTSESARNTPFYANGKVVNVDLQHVPFRNNSMSYAFSDCEELQTVSNINSKVTNIYATFNYCFNLNCAISIPDGLTTAPWTFNYCLNFNSIVTFPSSMTNLYATFYTCYNFNQNVQIPDSVDSMISTFDGCRNLNQNIKMPSSLKSMYATFYRCYNLKQSIDVPNRVTNMSFTFQNCHELEGNFNVYTTELEASYRTFWYTNASKTKNVYIYYQYANGVYTNTYNLVVANTDSSYKWTGQNGVQVYNMGRSPW